MDTTHNEPEEEMEPRFPEGFIGGYTSEYIRETEEMSRSYEAMRKHIPPPRYDATPLSVPSVEHKFPVHRMNEHEVDEETKILRLMGTLANLLSILNHNMAKSRSLSDIVSPIFESRPIIFDHIDGLSIISDRLASNDEEVKPPIFIDPSYLEHHTRRNNKKCNDRISHITTKITMNRKRIMNRSNSQSRQLNGVTVRCHKKTHK